MSEMYFIERKKLPRCEAKYNKIKDLSNKLAIV